MSLQQSPRMVPLFRHEVGSRRTLGPRLGCSFSALSVVSSCCQPVRALLVETHENWLEAHRYLNMEDLKEHKKSTFREASEPACLAAPPCRT
jgi:hypothetical protein